MSTKSTRVYITVSNEGVAFGHRGQVRSARTGKVLRAAKLLRPYGMQANARRDAEIIVNESDGYVLVSGRGMHS